MPLARTHARTHAGNSMSGLKIPTTLPELRQLHGLLNQVIAGMEILNGERPMPPLSTTVVSVVETRDAQRSLPPAKGREGRKPIEPSKRFRQQQEQRAGDMLRNHNNETDILEIVRAAGGSITPRELMGRLKLKDLSSVRARTAPLLKARKLIALGATLNRRLALPETAKEAP